MRKTASYARFHDNRRNTEPRNPANYFPSIFHPVPVDKLHSPIAQIGFRDIPHVRRHLMIFKGRPDCLPEKGAKSVDNIQANCQRRWRICVGLSFSEAPEPPLILLLSSRGRRYRVNICLSLSLRTDRTITNTRPGTPSCPGAVLREASRRKTQPLRHLTIVGPELPV